MISIHINVSEFERGKGFWRLNTSLLYDKDAIRIIKSEIDNTVNNYTMYTDGETCTSISDQMLFEMIKLNIRSKIIPYSGKKKKKLLHEEARLEEAIGVKENDLLKLRDDQRRETVNLVDSIGKLKNDLKNLRQPKIQAAMLRSRANLYEMSEKPTSYFCNLEKRNYVNKLISRVKTETGTFTDQTSILAELKHFYQNLYSSKVKSNNSCYLNQFLKPENIKSLGEEEKDLCEGLITDT